jgi:hypothetical protein
MQPQDRRRFEELVLYIAERTKDDPDFGTTKLAKTLFYSDMEAYRRLGEPITAATYYKWDHGPYPKGILTAAVNLLRGSHVVDVIKGGSDFQADRLVPTGSRDADLSDVGVSAEQRAIIDDCIKRVREASARTIKRLSHDHPGYRLATKNGAIDIDSAFLAVRPPSDEAVAAATRIATKRGWLVDGRWQR